jgi:hypothetical protein
MAYGPEERPGVKVTRDVVLHAELFDTRQYG